MQYTSSQLHVFLLRLRAGWSLVLFLEEDMDDMEDMDRPHIIYR